MGELEPDHRYRLSDAERDEALGNLRLAFEEGRLDTEEHERRTDAALRAVSNAGLVPLFEDLPRRLVPSAVTAPEPVGPAPATDSPAVPGPREGEVAESASGSSAPAKREGRGPNMNGLIFLGGFFFILWGIPAITSGSAGALIGWAIFMVVFMVPAVTVATVQGLRRRAENRPETEK
ncbi:DUF1707 domain-containing protein [Nocardiopsis terrae]